MNIMDEVFRFRVLARGYDEKVDIIRKVARNEGRKGVAELERLTDHKPGELETYANLKGYFEDRNRSRRQRPKKKRVTAGELISPEIQKKLQPWLELNKNHEGVQV